MIPLKEVQPNIFTVLCVRNSIYRYCLLHVSALHGPSQATNRVTTDAHDICTCPQNAARPNTKEDTFTIQNYKKMCNNWT